VKKTCIHFNDAEDIQLMECVKLYGEHWSRISKLMFKSMVMCHKRYLQLVNPDEEHASKISWSPEEDKILFE